MDDKIDRLLNKVDRLLMHMGHSVPPEVIVVDDIRKLVGEIRAERGSGVMAENKNDHWKDIGTSNPENEPGQHAQDMSRKPPTKGRQEAYEKAGEAGRQTGETFKK